MLHKGQKEQRNLALLAAILCGLVLTGCGAASSDIGAGRSASSPSDNMPDVSENTQSSSPNNPSSEVGASSNASSVAASSAAASSSASNAASSSPPGSSSSGAASSSPSSHAGGVSSEASSSAGESSISSEASSSSSSSSEPANPISNECISLVTNPNVNWRDSTLQSDQEIVECLFQTLGRPVGYGENARGGYDPNGNSKLTIIRKNTDKSVEQQIADAIADDNHNWIVFDKFDFADSHEIALYRLHCGDKSVQERLSASEPECANYRFWCLKRFYISESRCQDEFFNKALNRSSLPIRNAVIGSNTTIDGRHSNAYFRFNGFSIGRDNGGTPTQTASSVIVTHLDFQGTGHVENHALDPDMIRSTGASRDIWIHKNTFNAAVDSAFDVKAGAHRITVSFNRLVDVKRTALHGADDKHTIDAQITTTLHHNAFITRDRLYEDFAKDGRWVPLIRHGKSHMFNNVFMNYRKDVVSIRAGGSLLWQDNMFIMNESRRLKNAIAAELNEMKDILIRDIDRGNFRGEGIHLWAADGGCNLDDTNRREITAAHGSVADLSQDYSQASREVIGNQRVEVGQELVDYVSATAGRGGQMPFNSPLAGDRHYVLGLGRVPCQ